MGVKEKTQIKETLYYKGQQELECAGAAVGLSILSCRHSVARRTGSVNIIKRHVFIFSELI